ncbi:MAG: DUF5685 family protein [Oscillospiraceae bacterium]
MFGYIVANNEILSEDEKKRYKACYCGLCRALKQRHGQSGRVTLTYDMTFLVLLLNSLYEPSDTEGQERCVLHPVHRHDYALTEITDYAADMNVALAYLNLLDNWHDDKNIFCLFQAHLLKKKYKKISEEYPRQCGMMVSCLTQLVEFEGSGVHDPDTGAKLFGDLMGEIFVRQEDRWSPSLRAMASALGRFIYIMDAVVDLDKDLKKGSFNPLVSLKNSGHDDEYFRDLLTILIGDCTIEFEKLPLVEDIGIMRNILYSGVWTRYELEQAKKARRKGEKRQ